MTSISTSSISRAVGLCAAGVLVSAIVPARADAQYLDPGASSILIQSIVAGLVAVGALVKVYWWKISHLFARRNSDDTKAS